MNNLTSLPLRGTAARISGDEDDFDWVMAPSAVKCLSLAAFVAYDFPPRETLLAPWLQSSSINMLTAYRGTGKTWVALSIALAVASGGRFLTFNAPAAKRVLYIDGEMAGVELQERAVQLLKSMPEIAPENFMVINPDLQERPLPDIATKSGQLELVRWTANADLIVVDNLSSLARTGIENDAESWGPVADWALSMRREGRAVLFVHHAGKSGKQRGTSKREDVLDTSIVLNPQSDATRGASFDWEWTKARGLHGADVQPLRAELITSSSGDLTWSRSSRGGEKLAQVQLLKSRGMKVRQVADQLGMSRSAAGRLFKQCSGELDDVPSSHPL